MRAGRRPCVLHLQHLTGLDVFGPAELYVAACDAGDARAVLAGLDEEE